MIELTTFADQCCDARFYLELGKTCAETGDCYNTLRPLGATLWFSIPYRLGLSPATVLVPLHLLLASISIALSLPALQKLLRSATSRGTSLPTSLLLLLASVLAHSIFLLPVTNVALSDAPAGSFALIALWLLILLPPHSIRRTVMLAFAGLLLGLAAWTRIAYFYALLLTLATYMASWCLDKQRRRSELALLLAVLPIFLQYTATWSHTHRISYVDPQVSTKLLHEHRDNTFVGCDSIAETQQEWHWLSRCGNIEGLVPSLTHGNMRSAACLLSGRVNFYLGSYSPVTYASLGGYEGVWGANLLQARNSGSSAWHMHNLIIEKNAADAPDKTHTADYLRKPDLSAPAEITQTITLQRQARPYVFSTWLWGETSTSLMASNAITLMVRKHDTGVLVASQDIPLVPEHHTYQMEAVIPETGTYDVGILSPQAGSSFYLWQDLDLRLPEPAIENTQESRIRYWSPWLLLTNGFAVLLALSFIRPVLQCYNDRRALVTGLCFVALCTLQAIVSLPEQRFFILPMIVSWIFAAGFIALLWYQWRLPKKILAPMADLRREYSSAGLRRKDLAADPFKQFDTWFRQAHEADVLDPNAMVVATVGKDGQPSARNVLLKGSDQEGFLFYTNLESRKAAQINDNQKVALLFTWLPLNRQVKIEGVAEKLSTTEALHYFLSRPKESQWAAWASQQSRSLSSRQILEEKFLEMKRKFSSGDVPLPSFWGGYRVRPHRIEFWQGRENRLHDRFVYVRQQDNSWTLERLAP